MNTRNNCEYSPLQHLSLLLMQLLQLLLLLLLLLMWCGGVDYQVCGVLLLLEALLDQRLQLLRIRVLQLTVLRREHHGRAWTISYAF